MQKLPHFILAASFFAGSQAIAQEAAPVGHESESEFEILMESDQPEGWPEPGPAFEVTLKHYPAYRAAVVKGGNGFWPLFRHISDREIPMTAPVEMQVAEDEGRYKMTSMAFLYQSIEVGEAGETDDGVVVIDYPALTAVSFGSNGGYNQERIDEILEGIDAHLDTIADEWLPTGEMRVMGYNSPMVPLAKRYFEVQVLVEPVPVEEDAEDAAAEQAETTE